MARIWHLTVLCPQEQFNVCEDIAINCCRQYMNGGVCKSKERIDGKVVIVTGANTGIGKETAKDLVQRGMQLLTEFNIQCCEVFKYFSI